jgi:hypothetical protein
MIALESALLGGCASLPGSEAYPSAATLRTTAPLVPVAAYGRTDSQRDRGEKVTPAKSRYSDRVEAMMACANYAAATGGFVVITSGTPSMEPLIHGKTYVVVQNRSYESIAKSDLLVYMGRPDSSRPDRVRMLHRAVQHDQYGWVMSGDNNRWSESWDRVTPKTYLGIVTALFEYPQS